ncbi:MULTISPECIES: CtsR family transcriptional regulator [unclassified Granulicatella]|uniref:CtsR family transcriptional regulator n=1 Tax=unclassified Granulicatella TaxID=2630493 RepID=UPI0010737956|nr:MULTISPECIES: CtsR family transcriptional regulator [unclassified Granulicatella]MBF0780344.1 CtsR family transcriptional regulator [Granulicatella sp. 19428wC4_WM01]TFU95523.1 CtsR family transcriptional regulator [Granulicatella sp. WM01]
MEYKKNVSIEIERYLKKSLAESQENYIVVKRCDLANQFDCVPSQINYVIKTRFRRINGFFVESKRGGSGYIRIEKARFVNYVQSLNHIMRTIDKQISAESGMDIINILIENDMISRREFYLLQTLVNYPLENHVRAELLRMELEQLKFDN